MTDFFKISSEDNARKVLENPNGLKKLLNQVTHLCEKGKDIPGIGEYLFDIASLCRMVEAYAFEGYKSVPVNTIAMVVAFLAYLIMPMDLVADAIPAIGYLDDATMLKLVLDNIHDELQKFRNTYAA